MRADLITRYSGDDPDGLIFDWLTDAPEPVFQTWLDAARLAETSEAEADIYAKSAYSRIKGQVEAERRIAAENYTGGRELSWEEMLDDAALEWLVDGLIAKGTVNFLVAKSNLGKTFTYTAMMLSLVTGQDFLGRATIPGKVVFVLGEGKQGFMLRVLAWCQENEIDPELVRSRCAFYDGGNLNNDASIADLGALIDRVQPSVIVLDTYAALSGVADEDKSALASITVNRARALAPDAALLLVHHPNKSTEDKDNLVMRGSGALAGTADTVMTMYLDRKYKSKGAGKHDFLALSTEREHGGKNRHAQRVTIQGLYLKSVDVEGRGETAVLVHDDSGSLSPHDVFVMTHMTPGETVTLKDVQEAAGVSDKTAREHLQKSALVDVTTREGDRAKYYTMKDSE